MTSIVSPCCTVMGRSAAHSTHVHRRARTHALRAFVTVCMSAVSACTFVVSSGARERVTLTRTHTFTRTHEHSGRPDCSLTGSSEIASSHAVRMRRATVGMRRGVVRGCRLVQKRLRGLTIGGLGRMSSHLAGTRGKSS